MIKDFRNLPALARWFLQSQLEITKLERLGDPNLPRGDFLLRSQKVLVEEIFRHIVNSKGQNKTDHLIEYIVVSGDAGVGKTTIMKHLVARITESGLFSQNEVMCVSIMEHSSLDSFYSLCSRIARQINLRKDSAALEELEGPRDRKDIAVLNVLKHFQLLFFDDIDADDHETWKYVLGITKKCGHSLQVIGSSSNNVRKNYENLQNLHMFHVNSIDNTEMRELFGKLLHNDGPFPEFYFTLASGIPFNICAISSILNHNKNISFLVQCSANVNVDDTGSQFPSVITSQLDHRNKYLLAQLSKIRRPLPVKDSTVFKTLLDSALVLLEYQGTQAFLLVPSSIQKMRKSLMTYDDLACDEFKNCSALELWKDIMSPKLKEILRGCETENWTFVPESW